MKVSNVPLEQYRGKRRFQETPEPKGAKGKSRSGRSFVVQMHKARRLHYDFRLELDGVLKSWAVPKGPCLDPYEKRLAVHVEDHPIEYGDFEGVIPPGQYGAGTVVLWDRGIWTPVEDPHEGYRQGKLKFRLDGEKLQGGWTLVRMRGREGEKADNWLLIKERDESARSLAEYDILDDRPESVASGKTSGQIAAAPERAWSKSGETKVKRKSPKKKASRRGTIKGARKAALPEKLKPQMCNLAGAAPEGERWLHEIKLDGYRLLLRVEKGKARLITRNQLDWTHRFPELAAAAADLPVREALLDGEVVALLAGGVSSFQALQEALSSGETGKLVYYAFDVLHLDGYDLTQLPLEERKKHLADLLKEPHDARIQYLDHIEGSGPEFFRQSCQMGLEGIISKVRDRPYRGERSKDWLKVKCVQKEEFVIGGYTRPTAAGRTGLGALLVGYYDAKGNLVYAGRVGTGFSEKTLVELRQRLNSLEQGESPFAQVPKERLDRNVRWVRPDLVAQVEFSNWTGDGLLRHPSFQGLREDKAPKMVTHNPAAESKATAGRKPKRNNSRAAADSPESRQVELSPEQLEQLGRIRLTNPDRVLYPEQGLTKLGLAAYYVQIAEWILPHLADRPVSIVRCPEGHTHQCFFQKHAAVGTPDALGRVAIREKEGKQDYLVIRDLAGLISAVQMGGLELHPWGSRTDNIERPDRVVFDLDPDPAVPWRKLVEAAHHVREFLDDMGLVSFLKTTGGKGLHLVVPIQRRHEWEEVKVFTQAVAKRMAGDSPKLYVATASKQARKGKIYIDYLRNARGATAVAAYSTRARAGAPVSTPLAWDELSPAISPDHFRVDNLPGRLASLEADPWAEIGDVRQSITAKMKKQVGL
jgi:bifunctional non-homologous end joining protein LigD